MIELTLAVGVLIIIVVSIFAAFCVGVRKELDRVDDWWKPSEAGRLAKERFDAAQADKEQKQILRFANKPKYQQPNRSNP